MGSYIEGVPLKYYIIFVCFFLGGLFLMDKLAYSVGDEIQKEKWNYVVRYPYFDKPHHNFKTLAVTSLSSNLDEDILITNETTGFFEMVRANDTLLKESDTLLVVIHRGGEVISYNMKFSDSRTQR